MYKLLVHDIVHLDNLDYGYNKQWILFDEVRSIKVIAALWVAISFGNKEIHLHGYIFVHIIKCTGSNTTLNMGIV